MLAMKNKLNKELAVCGFSAVKTLEKNNSGVCILLRNAHLFLAVFAKFSQNGKPLTMS